MDAMSEIFTEHDRDLATVRHWHGIGPVLEIERAMEMNDG